MRYTIAEYMEFVPAALAIEKDTCHVGQGLPHSVDAS